MARGRCNLLAFPSSLLDPPSLYRCIGPLAALRQNRPTLQVSVIQDVNWAVLALADVVMLQRPWSDNQHEIAKLAVRHGIPIWVDHDDDIFNIPKGNPAYAQYMNPGVHGNIASILRMADFVTVSTPALGKVFDRVRGSIVIPNALMTNVVGQMPDHSGRPRAPIVYWRGSSTHQRDLDTYTEQMVSVAAENPETPWVFQGIGESNYGLIERIRGAQPLKHTDPLEYFHGLGALCPKVVVVPLDDNPFNRSKSNIAWLEATYAGAVCVAPNWPEWQRPGVLNYEPENFATILNAAIRLPADEQNALWERSAKYVRDRLLVHDVNMGRDRILDACEQMRRDDKWRMQKRSMLNRPAA